MRRGPQADLAGGRSRWPWRYETNTILPGCVGGSRGPNNARMRLRSQCAHDRGDRH
jgi:hypothetical protein